MQLMIRLLKVKSWLDFYKCSMIEDPESESDTRKQPLFNNRQVRYESKSVFVKFMIHLCIIAFVPGIGPYQWDTECLTGDAQAPGVATGFPTSIGMGATFR